ncbi:MAG: hypothetical protein HY314_01150 [Acidobacteria bacterium]|nr:hypothetical protein [Acidobacteriota bacterium]
MPDGSGAVRIGPDNTIGGTAIGARNVISGNYNVNMNGVVINGSNSIVQGNYIGTKADGISPLPNSMGGIAFGATDNSTIGGTTPGAGNIIAFNGSNCPGGPGFYYCGGVTNAFGGGGSGNIVISNSIFSNYAGAGIAFSTGSITVSSNSIFGNTGLGIDLGAPLGVTPNDPGDGDSGANNLQNFPELTSASVSTRGTTIEGTLNSTPDTSFTLEFFWNNTCDPSGFGEGQSFIDSRVVRTDGGGVASFRFTFSTKVFQGKLITATATDPSGNTSKFSRCMTVTGTLPDVDVTVTALSSSSSCSGDRCDMDLQATIANLGTAPAMNVQVEFAFSSNGGASYTKIGGPVNAGTIPGSGTATATTTWRNVSPGSYLVRVTVDPNEHIDESDETNNAMNFPVPVP